MMVNENGEPIFRSTAKVRREKWYPAHPKPETQGLYSVYLGHSYRDNGPIVGYSYWNGVYWSCHTYVLEACNAKDSKRNEKQDFLWKEVGND